MASDKLKLYNRFMKNEADGVIALESDTLKVVLLASTSNAATLTLEFYSQLTNELSTANGYTLTGIALANPAVTETAGVTKYDADDSAWTAGGGPIAARFAVVYDDTATGKPLVGYVLLDNAPADLTAVDTQQFLIQWHADGIFTLAANNA